MIFPVRGHEALLQRNIDRGCRIYYNTNRVLGLREKMAKVLVKTDRYNGRYVAMKSFNDTRIVGSGKDPETALKQATAKGFKDPVLVYIPEKEMVHIY